MERIPEVETARALMNEATTWSVMKWLREKKRVRKTADHANAVLDQSSLAAKERWPAALRAAYTALITPADGKGAGHVPQKQASQAIDPEANRIARTIREADDEAYRARMDAENAFDEAERQLSTKLAREGCRKAIHAWDMHEKAIHKAQAAGMTK